MLCIVGNITVNAINLFNGSINFINVTIVNYNVTGDMNIDGNITVNMINVDHIAEEEEDHNVVFDNNIDLEDKNIFGVDTIWGFDDAMKLNLLVWTAIGQTLGSLSLNRDETGTGDITTEMWLEPFTLEAIKFNIGTSIQPFDNLYLAENANIGGDLNVDGFTTLDETRIIGDAGASGIPGVDAPDVLTVTGGKGGLGIGTLGGKGSDIFITSGEGGSEVSAGANNDGGDITIDTGVGGGVGAEPGAIFLKIGGLEKDFDNFPYELINS